jgi:two-component system sensor histidine kinase CreC
VVEGDPFLLRRALSNLLDNALDFSPEGSVVQLSLTGQRCHALIAVHDQGTGIPDYAQDKVFEKFSSLARLHSQKESTGLGLSFVKEIAALHHGRIELHNRPEDEGPGTAATLTLPRAPA